MSTARRRLRASAGARPRVGLAAKALTVLAAVVSVAALAGCQLAAGAQAPQAPQSAAADAAGQVPAQLASFYEQDVRWQPCEGQFSCATVKVPMDYAHPDGATIDIAAIRSSAAGSRSQGTIVVNPGGPGGSGYDFVKDSASQLATKKLRDAYDLVGFDPRGVGRSTAVSCLNDQERDQYRAEDFNLDTAEGLAAATASARDFAAKCAANTGPLLGFVDTASAARDMDILRAVVGETKLDYLGFSYGTSLGATYADLFPQRVGRFVLDGAVDPSLTSEQLTLGQAAGFENAIHAYAKDCLSSAKCPLTGTVDEAVQKIRNLIASVAASPMRATDGRVVNVSTFVSGFILPLYNTVNWPLLTSALTSAFNGDPTPMLRLADYGADRGPDGHYTSNSNFAFTAVTCLDSPTITDPAAMRADEQQLEAASPTIGKYLAYGGVTCGTWAEKPVGKPHPIHAAGAAPIVVIGTTGDPATPYPWAQSLASQLDSGVLLSWHGEGHTAYGRSNSCVSDAVDNYFINGTVPAKNTMC